MATDQRCKRQIKNQHGLLRQQEVARILTARGEPITKGGVFMAEQRALKKLRAGLAEFVAENDLL